MRRTALAVLTALLLPPAAQAVNLRVLVDTEPQVTVLVPAPASANDGGSASLNAPAPLPSASALPASAWTVGVTGQGAGARLTLNGQDAGTATLYLPPSAGSSVEIGGKLYRGGVQLRVGEPGVGGQGSVQAINVLDIEDYLRGVVAAEMPSSWPSAALQAQAVIARTYAAARINPAAPYDTCATEACQMYVGVSGERASADAAIRATRAQVVAYAGRAASTYFSSDSGGFTASSAEVWGRDLPYLPAQPDPFSVLSGSPRAKWRMDIPLANVQAVVNQYARGVGAVRSVAITRLSASGRPAEITLTGARGRSRIAGASAGGFIRSLGAGSTRVTLGGLGAGGSGPLTIEGYGLGHGVGLSQYGALGLAQKGYDHLHVLGFYYPGTSLSLLADAGRLPALAQAAPLPTLAQTLAELPLERSLAELAARPGHRE